VNILHPLPPAGPDEEFTALLDHPAARIERIVSRGQVTAQDAPYDQDRDEWVLLLSGAARLWLEDRGEIALTAGDTLFIPAHLRHRVMYTQAEPPTVWLAIHLEPR
jgi:cupin 2 domain-containing protein